MAHDPTYIDRFVHALAGPDAATAHEVIAAHDGTWDGYASDGQSPVLAALFRGHRDLAERVASRRTLDVLEACALGRLDDVTRLIAHGVPLDAYTPDGWTALHLAAFMGHEACVRQLLAAGAEVDAVSRNYMANTALCAAIAGTCSEPIARLLMEAGASATFVAGGGATPLHLAASRGSQAIVDALLAAGASDAATMSDGKRPADIARERGHDAVASALEGRVSA